jgi:hypothetical protein
VHGEALQVGWGNSKNHFQTSECLDQVVTCLFKPPFNWLSRIELNFSYAGYFDLFGFWFSGLGPVELDTRHSGSLLAYIPTLKNLWFTLPNPYDDDHRTPWSNFEHQFGDEDWFHLSQEERDVHIRCCTRQLAGWLLTLAFPYIKKIPNIHLGGCIKASVKARWERIFKDARYKQDQDLRSDGFVWKEAMEEVLKLTPTNTPVCTCPLSCIEEAARRQFALQDKQSVVEWDRDYDHDDVFSRELLERAFQLYWRVPFKGLRIKVVGPEANLLALEAQYPAEEADADGTWADGTWTDETWSDMARAHETWAIGVEPMESSEVEEETEQTKLVERLDGLMRG